MVRTDMAVEFMEGKPEISGVTLTKHSLPFPVTEVLIEAEEAAERIGKPCGHYLTAEGLDLSKPPHQMVETAQKLAPLLDGFLPKLCKSALVVGLGNREVTPDSLGPRVVKEILVTRHFSLAAPRLARESGLDQLTPVCALAPGVLGQTGIEVSELIEALVKRLKPDVVIAVDALTAAQKSRLCRSLQFSDTGIVPGSGVANHRRALSEKTLGVPVIAIGVPTVIAFGDEGAKQETLFVTPRDADLCMEHAAKLIGLLCNISLQPSLSAEELQALAG